MLVWLPMLVFGSQMATPVAGQLVAGNSQLNASAMSNIPGQVTEVSRFPAVEARQGIAADERFIYVNENSAIGKYEKATGRKVGAWKGDPALFVHMNSCAIHGALLVCAASNYPQVPMASSAEFFDPRTMTHVGSYSFGPGQGSLTWLNHNAGSWWAAFANYDGRGGEPSRGHRWTTLVRLDSNFRQTGAWLFPQSILERFAPYSSSGGAWGPDRLLYVTGHDRRELYAVRIPPAGSTLLHVGTIGLVTDGQAIDWDPVEPRLLWSVDRKTRQAVSARVPPLAKKP